MIIVTGGAGFIGSVILWQLNELGLSDLIVVDDMNTDDRWKNVAKRSLLSICRRDDFLSQLPRLANDGIDAIIHMGACSSTTERNMDFLIQNNLNYSQEIFNFCTDWSIPFLYASSAATYGGGEFGFSDEGSPKLLPINGYGYSKYLFDCWVEKQKRFPLFGQDLSFSMFMAQMSIIKVLKQV